MVNDYVNNVFFCIECLSLPFSEKGGLTTKSLLTRTRSSDSSALYFELSFGGLRFVFHQLFHV